MKRTIIVLILILSCMLPTHVLSEPVIIEDEWVYLEANPHTIGSSGYVEFTLISKQFSGDIDAVWGFVSEEARPRRPQIWKNYTHTLWKWGDENATDELTLYNITEYKEISKEEFLNQTNRIGNEWNKEFYNVTCFLNEIVGTCYIGLISKSGNLQELQVTYLYNITVKKYYQETFPDWKPWNVNFKVIQYDYSGMDTWFLLRNITVEQGEEYRVRAYIEVPFSGLEITQGKYCWGIKRSSDTVKEAVQSGRFYFIDPWWDCHWLLSRRLTFNNSASTENLTNFPVLVTLTASNMDWESVQIDGDDLRFIDSDNTTELDYEIEQWDYVGEEAEIWVEAPQIDAGSTIDHVFMYYNNSEATSGEDIEGTWNQDYVMVQHLQEQSGTIYDSTANDNDGAVSPITFAQNKWVSGLRGNALEFDKDNDHVRVSDADELDLTTGITLEAWIYPHSDGEATYGRILEKGDGDAQYELSVYSGDDLMFDLVIDTTRYMLYHNDFGGIDPWNKWYHVIATWENNTKMKIYVNNTLESESGSLINGTIDAGANRLGIGASGGGFNSFDGVIEDLRMYDRAINSTEISYSYNSGAGADPLDTTGLVGWWKFDESGLTENATDSSGEGNHGTLYGYPPEHTSSGKIEGATEFDGYDDGIIVPVSASMNVGSEITISAWINIPSSWEWNGWRDLVSRSDDWRFETYSIDNRMFIWIKDVDGSVTSTAFDTFTRDTFHFLSTTYEVGDELRVYLNGSLGNHVGAGNTIKWTDSRSLGIGYSGWSEYINGIIDELRMSNVSRSADWIEAQYLSMTDQFITYSSASGMIIELFISVVDSKMGRAVEDALVTLFSEGGTAFSDFTDSDGEIVRLILDEGNYTLMVSAETYRTYGYLLFVNQTTYWVAELDTVERARMELVVLTAVSLLFTLMMLYSGQPGMGVISGTLAFFFWEATGLYWMYANIADQWAIGYLFIGLGWICVIMTIYCGLKTLDPKASKDSDFL